MVSSSHKTYTKIRLNVSGTRILPSLTVRSPEVDGVAQDPILQSLVSNNQIIVVFPLYKVLCFLKYIFTEHTLLYYVKQSIKLNGKILMKDFN